MAENALLRDVMTLRRALENKKLVIFVGGGVSVNSSLPTWRELVMKFAEEIDYFSDESNKKPDLTSDDLLKIPQYVYDFNPERYAKIIEETMKVNMPANVINEKILEILPNHIITTNYDQLFENVSDPNLSQYHIISSDSHLLTNSGEHYLIKMHGDIDDLDKIVLKENDYLNYSNQRILIETFIKSLLVDHIFLFVGYSLSDFNLKQIMTWVEYLSDKENVSENRHHNFTFQTIEIKHFEKIYWENKNLFIIDSNSLPETLIEKYSDSSLSLKDGQLLYTFLCLLLDESSDLEIEENASLVLERYEAYDPVNYLYAYDLLERSMIKDYDYEAGRLTLHSKEQFDRWQRLLSNEPMRHYWSKSGIREIQSPGSKITIEIPLSEELSKEKDCMGHLMSFDYRTLASNLTTSDLSSNRISYYQAQLNPSSQETYVNFKRQSNTQWDRLLSRYNDFLYHRLLQTADISIDTEIRRYIDVMTPYEKNVYHYLFSLLEQGENLKRKEFLARLVAELEQSYLKPSFNKGNPEKLFSKLKTRVYEHFWFFKLNGILLDQDRDTQYNFQYYIKALLVSQVKADSMAAPYEWELLDVHLFLMNACADKTSTLFKLYPVQTITLSKEVDLVKIATNFFDSILYTLDHQDHRLIEKLSNLTLLIRLVEMTKTDKGNILSSVIQLVTSDSFREYRLDLDTIDELCQLILYLVENEAILDIEDLSLLVKERPFEALPNRPLYQIAKAIQRQSVKFNNDLLAERWSELEAVFTKDCEKLWLVTNLLPILPESIVTRYQPLFEANLNRLDPSLLVRLCERKVVNPAKIQPIHWLNRIEDALLSQDEGSQSSLVTVETIIEECVILYLHGIFDELTFLTDFIEFSVFLQFFLDVEHFDFSKIDLKHPVWVKVFQHKTYRAVILEKGREPLRQAVKHDMNLHQATELQRKVFYKYLADEEEEQEVWLKFE